MTSLIEFSLDTSEHLKEARRVTLLSSQGIPNAVKYVLDELAVRTGQAAKRGLKSKFVLRNTWTARNTAFEKTTFAKDLSLMESAAGSRLTYMAEQEAGARHTAGGKHGVPIPTPMAAGQAAGSRRTKLVRRANWLSRMKPLKGVYADALAASSNRKQHYAVAVAMTKRARKRFLYWQSARTGRKGLYKLAGDAWKIEMVYDLSHRRTYATARHWLLKPTSETLPLMHSLFARALRYQLYKLRT